MSGSYNIKMDVLTVIIKNGIDVMKMDVNTYSQHGYKYGQYK